MFGQAESVLNSEPSGWRGRVSEEQSLRRMSPLPCVSALAGAEIEGGRGRAGVLESATGVAAAAVVLLHAGLLTTLMVVLRTSTRSSSREDFVSISILVPAPPPPSAALNRQRPPTTNQIGPITPIEPLIVPPPEISLPNAPSTSIDWECH
jgi:hypothetical protein